MNALRRGEPAPQTRHADYAKSVPVPHELAPDAIMLMQGWGDGEMGKESIDNIIYQKGNKAQI